MNEEVRVRSSGRTIFDDTKRTVMISNMNTQRQHRTGQRLSARFDAPTLITRETDDKQKNVPSSQRPLARRSNRQYLTVCNNTGRVKDDDNDEAGSPYCVQSRVLRNKFFRETERTRAVESKAEGAWRMFESAATEPLRLTQ